MFSNVVYHHQTHLMKCITMTIFTILCTSNAELKNLGCEVHPDPVFQGLFVNCSDKGLTRSDLNLLENPHKISHLDISVNNFQDLGEGLFERFVNLSRLDCQQCSLWELEAGVFRGLEQLQVLHLEDNHLSLFDEKFSKVPFKKMTNLKELYISKNENSSPEQSKYDYSQYIDIFYPSMGITHLAIDSFGQFSLGKEFLNLTNLYYLDVHFTTHTKVVTNDSLKEFQNSSVKVFGLSGGDTLHPMHEIGMDLFKYFPLNVSHLFIHGPKFSNWRLMRMFKRFNGRVFHTLSLKSIYTPAFGVWEDKARDSIFDAEDLEILGNITVSNFYWYDCAVAALQPVMPASWQTSLKNFAIQSDAMIETDIIYFFKALQIKQLENWAVIALRTPYRNLYSLKQYDGSYLLDPVMISHDIGREFCQMNNNKMKLSEDKNTFESLEIHSSEKSSESEKRHFGLIRNSPMSDDFLDKCLNGTLVGDENDEEYNQVNTNFISWSRLEDLVKSSFYDPDAMFDVPKLILRCPKNLKSVFLDSIHYVHFKFQICMKDCNLQNLIITNTLNELTFTGNIYGLRNLRTVNLRGSNIVNGMNLDFFDSLPSIRNLVLSQTSPSPIFYQKNAQTIIKRLINLEYFELAHSGLSSLPSDMFNSNKLIKHANFETNILSAIPFDLKYTPELEILDLQNNIFTGLSSEERAVIDEHIQKVPTFKIKFGGNKLSCTCSDYHFIAWFQSHTQHFDNNANFSCTAAGGIKKYTSSFRDVMAFWRICQGESSFLTSLTLACALIAMYLSIFIGMKKKTQILSQLRQWLVPGFKMKTRQDFSIDVCIGYAVQDGEFLREIVLKYLEQSLRLTTFVHERDLRQDPLQMHDALHDCWRCILLITESFLYHDPMAHNFMKVATFFVNPTHPRKVIVMVEERVKHQIPAFVLQVVDEDDIIVLPSLQHDLDYDARQTLDSRIKKCS